MLPPASVILRALPPQQVRAGARRGPQERPAIADEPWRICGALLASHKTYARPAISEPASISPSMTALGGHRPKVLDLELGRLLRQFPRVNDQ